MKIGNHNRKLLILGECLLELSLQERGCYKQNFAGDTYNTAVYAKRWDPSLSVSYYTGVGVDVKSSEFLTCLKEEGIDFDWVKRDKEKQMGLYMICLEENGERDFLYWRSDSAARLALKSLPGVNDVINEFDAVYVSGITLAIMDSCSRQNLIKLLNEVRNSGLAVIFDPNYRPALWSSAEEAKEWITQCYSVSSVALPGLDDHGVLFRHKSVRKVKEFLEELGLKQLVIKAGTEGVFCYINSILEYHQPFQAARQQIDATAAGDSFAGVLIAELLGGNHYPKAIFAASSLAKEVVAHPGAIIDRAVVRRCRELVDTNNLLY